MTWPSIGSYWESSSVIWGKPSGGGEVVTCQSPLGAELQSIRQLSDSELATLFQPQPGLEPTNLAPQLESLAALLKENRAELINELRASMGFTPSDCAEVFEGCLSLVERFSTESKFDSQNYTQANRVIGLQRVPWGTVAAILPQNASFYMGLIVLLNGLASGNQVILRSPSGSYRLMAILAVLAEKAGFDPRSYSIVACDARSFAKAWEMASHPILLHFMGSSNRAAEMLATAFTAGKPCIIDGEGNGWLYVDQDQDPSEAAQLAWEGAIRYNGQTCTSVNGVVVHPSIDQSFRQALRSLAQSTSFGVKDSDQVGPVFNSKQAQHLQYQANDSKGRVGKSGQVLENLAPPMLIEDPATDSSLVRDGLFGPAVWVRTGDWQEFKELWQLNRYPLCGAVLSYDEKIQREAFQLTGASRIVLNGDPSIEDPLEPWGAYPCCGSNTVSNWMDKYFRVVQVDRAERS